MARTTTITCDVCGKTKGEANHWWIYFFHQKYGRFQCFPGDYGFDPEDEEENGDICSEQCAIRKLSEVLATIQKRAVQEVG